MTSTSVLIMMFGQSNADAHDAGPPYTSELLDDLRIVVPNDGHNYRGIRHLNHPSEITGLHPIKTDRPNAQTIAGAAAAKMLSKDDDPDRQIIVRSAAKGGRPLLGFRRNGRIVEGIYTDRHGEHSTIFKHFLSDTLNIVNAAKAEGRPVKTVYIPFFHGEADRGLTQSVYGDALLEMIDTTDAELQSHGLETQWLLTQSSGPTAGHSGNAWANRLSYQDICDARPNVHFAGANYAYPLADSMHLSADSKVVVGEYIGHCISRLEAGQAIEPISVHPLITDEHTIELMFDTPHGITLDTDVFPMPIHTYGFNITGQPGQRIEDVRQTGSHTLHITTQDPIVQSAARLNYAYSTNLGCTGDDGSGYPFGRGCVREDWSEPSLILPDESVRNWLPAFSMSLEFVLALSKAA